MARCIKCRDELNSDNISEEHIIPNALGGKLKSRNCLCVKCNSELGRKCESEFVKSLGPLAIFFDIYRDRGENRPVSATSSDGEKYLLESGVRPSLSKPSVQIEDKENGNKEVHITARNVEEARKILKDLKRGYPNSGIDIDELMEKACYSQEYLQTPLNVKLLNSNVEFFRGIAKIALIFLKHRFPDIDADLHEIMAFIMDEADYKKIALFYPEAEVVTSPEGEVLHSIVVYSYAQEKLLVGFVELFGCISVVIALSEDFNTELQDYYVYDLINRKEIKEPIINIPKVDKVIDALKSGEVSHEKIKSKLERVMDISYQIQLDIVTSELIEESFDGEDEITEEGMLRLQKKYESLFINIVRACQKKDDII